VKIAFRRRDIDKNAPAVGIEGGKQTVYIGDQRISRAYKHCRRCHIVAILLPTLLGGIWDSGRAAMARLLLQDTSRFTLKTV